MPREPRVIKIPHPKPESLPEQKPKAKAKNELKGKPTLRKKQKVSKGLEQNAERLRQKPNNTELFLSERLTEEKLEFEFREVVCGFIPSFHFPQYKKVIILDWEEYKDKKRVAKQNNAFKSNGITALRIDPKRVFKQANQVIEEIMNFLSGNSKNRKKAKVANYEPIHNLLYHSELTLDELGKQLNESDTFEDFLLRKLEK